MVEVGSILSVPSAIPGNHSHMLSAGLCLCSASRTMDKSATCGGGCIDVSPLPGEWGTPGYSRGSIGTDSNYVVLAIIEMDHALQH